MKALVVTVYDAEYRKDSGRKVAKYLSGLKHIASSRTGEIRSLMIGTAVLLLGILACSWKSGYQEHIIRSLSNTFF